MNVKAAKLILAALVLFLAGVAGGSALSDLRWKSRVRAERDRREVLASPMGYRLEFLRRAQRELNLTSEQQGRIETYIRDGQERFRKLWEPVAPQVRTEMEAVRERIRAELTPEQQRKFDRMLRERWKRAEGRERRTGEEGSTNRSFRGSPGGEGR